MLRMQHRKIGPGSNYLVMVDPAGLTFKTQEGNGPVKGVDERASKLVL